MKHFRRLGVAFSIDSHLEIGGMPTPLCFGY